MSGFGVGEQGQAQGSDPPFNVWSLREELPSVEGGVSEGEGEDDEISSVESSEEGGQRFEPAEEQPFTGSQAAQTVTAADGGVATSQGKKRYTDEEWAAVKKEKKRKANERRKARRGRVRREQKAEQARKREEEKERKEKEEAARAQSLASVPTGPGQEQASRPHQPRGGLSFSRGRGGFTPSQPMRRNTGGQSHPPARPTSGNHQSRWSSPMGGSTTVGGRIVKSGPVNDRDKEKAAQRVTEQVQAMEKKAKKKAAAEKKKAEQERSELTRINASLLAEQQRIAVSLESERGVNRTIGEINLETQALQDTWSAMRDGWLRQQTQAMMQGASLAVEQWERLILQADGMLRALSLAHTEATNWVRDPSVSDPMERLRRRLRELQTGPQSAYQAVETIRNSREFLRGMLPTPPASLPSARRPLQLESGDVEMEEGEERGRGVVRARETRGRETPGSTGAFGGGFTINNNINYAYPPASGYGQYPVIQRRVRDDDEMEIEPASPVETETPWDSRTGRLPGQRLITGTAETVVEDQPTFRPRALLTGGSQEFDLDGRSIGGEDNVFDQSR